jgi:hypothetical protein
MFCIFFCAIGFFDEADSSILIYSELREGLYTKWIALDVALIKHCLNGDEMGIKTNWWRGVN